MKHLWGILILVSVAAVLFGGVSIVNNHIISVNPNLNDDSLALIGKYDDNINNLTQISQQRIDTTTSSNSTNQIDAFFREAAETKTNIEKFRDGIEYVWDLPELLLLSLPMLNQLDSSFLILFKGIVWFLIGAVILIVIVKAAKGNIDGGTD